MVTVSTTKIQNTVENNNRKKEKSRYYSRKRFQHGKYLGILLNSNPSRDDSRVDHFMYFPT